MKKILSILLCMVLVFALAACGAKPVENSPSENTSPKQADTNSVAESDTKENNNQNNTSTEAASDLSSAEQKMLVVYFSVPETTSADNMTDEEDYSTYVRNGEVLGNVQYVAYLIQENTGADIFRIEPTTAYPMNHAELEAVATQEKRDGAFPEIAAQIENFDQYDTVFVGFPNWYADMPRILYSLFENYNFSGKTIVPFVVSGGSGFSGSIGTITELEPDATVIRDGYSITRTRIEDAESGVADWLNGLGY
ncbi:flavodoxin [Enterocloster clostridioformis]|uniref:flavodoxin n=1 Tax=Enterocloster clostridioformis TaxID=1531 RepID=UPI00074074EB|nr:flavodoxin [Enterocloster clostridioformis]CUX74393.1 flavodoxin [Clostridium sp. C105KSO14]